MAQPRWTSIPGWKSHSEDNLNGFVSCLREADAVRTAFEVEKSTMFVSGKVQALFGKHDKIPEKCRIRFQDLGEEVVPYTGMPFIILSRSERHCLFGKDKHSNKKKRNQQKIDTNLEKDHPSLAKRKKMLQTSRKKDCPAKLIMKEVILFPDFKIKASTEKLKRTTSEKLRDRLQDSGSVKLKKEHRIYIRLPKDEEHENTHLLGEMIGFMNPINNSVREKISEFVGQGVSSVSEMRRHLRHFVSDTLFSEQNKPAMTDVAYYPTDNIIRKHIYMAQLRLRYSKLDQENLIDLVSEWQRQSPEDNFDFMPAGEVPTPDDIDVNNIETVVQDDDDEVCPQMTNMPASTSFFFCHQTKFQRHLLRRYGNSLCLLDATYRTTKYALPLFFLAVKTNVGFSVVGEFIVQNETKETIKQGLQTIQRWMEDRTDENRGWHWTPKFFMTDFSEREIYAIEETFPDCNVFLCDFHREQSWTRWVSKTDNGASLQKEIVLGLLRRCAHATTLTSYEAAVKKLKQSKVWETNTKLQNWFSKTWLPEYKRWAWACRNGTGLLVNTNNGLERQNKVFKYKYLEQKKNSSVSGMVTILILEYLPGMMFKYIKANATCMEGVGRKFHQDIPDFLRNRPLDFVKHCLSKIELSASIDKAHITQISETSYQVKSQSNNTDVFNVDVQGETQIPWCECDSWTWSLLPCKHIFAVIHHTETLAWDSLPVAYRSSPFFNVDSDVISFTNSFIITNPPDDIDDEEEDGNEVTASDADGGCILENLPSKKHKHSELKAAAVKCREELGIIQNYTYLCQDVESLQLLSEQLETAKVFIEEHLYPEWGLINESEHTKKKQKGQKRNEESFTYAAEPVLKKQKTTLKENKKQLTSKRVGISAEKKRKPISVVTQQPCKQDVVIDGHASVPLEKKNAVNTEEPKPDHQPTVCELLTKVQDFLSTLDERKFSDLVKTAISTSHLCFDLYSKYGQAVLDLYCKTENEYLDTMKLLCSTSPGMLSQTHKFRLVNLILGHLVEEKRILLQSNVDPRIKQEEMTKAMKDLQAAFYDMHEDKKDQAENNKNKSTKIKRCLKGRRPFKKLSTSKKTGIMKTCTMEDPYRKTKNVKWADGTVPEHSLQMTLCDIDRQKDELKNCCPCCGFSINMDKDTLVRCSSCERHFHKKNYCVGVEIAASKATCFNCKMCCSKEF